MVKTAINIGKKRHTLYRLIPNPIVFCTKYRIAAANGIPGYALFATFLPIGYQLIVSCHVHHDANPFSTTYWVALYWNNGSNAVKYAPYCSGSILSIAATIEMTANILISIACKLVGLSLLRMSWVFTPVSSAIV